MPGLRRSEVVVEAPSAGTALAPGVNCDDNDIRKRISNLSKTRANSTGNYWTVLEISEITLDCFLGF
jgi:hypothetical protein